MDRRSQHVSTRQRLIDGMADLLWERGYVGTSPSAVLEHTGVGQGSLYHHFDGKQGLAVAAIEANAEVLKAAARDTLLPPGHAYDRLERFLLRDREILRGCRIGRLTQDPEVNVNEALRRPVEETFRWIHQSLRDVVATGQQNGELNEALDPDEIASTIVATLQGGYVLARADQDPAHFHAAVRGVLALLRSQVRRP
jgi:TetR/AcrR family transcriptional repressor of nem operon